MDVEEEEDCWKRVSVAPSKGARHAGHKRQPARTSSAHFGHRLPLEVGIKLSLDSNNVGAARGSIRAAQTGSSAHSDNELVPALRPQATVLRFWWRRLFGFSW